MTTPAWQLCLFLLFTLPAFGAAETSPRVERRELPRESRPIEDVLVPVPREIFRSLDKFADSNWGAVQRRELAKAGPRGDQTQIALLLGTLTAEGFIAVEARDETQVKELARAVLPVAAALGVKRVVLRRSRAILNDAVRKDWRAARREWDVAFAEVEEAMRELGSEELSHLVSLGGWLRGTEGLSALVLQDYSVAGAELLRQPALLDYFEGRIAEMRPELRSRPLVKRMRQGMRKARPLMRNDPAIPMTEGRVRELKALATVLIEEITTRRRTGT